MVCKQRSGLGRDKLKGKGTERKRVVEGGGMLFKGGGGEVRLGKVGGETFGLPSPSNVFPKPEVETLKHILKCSTIKNDS